MARAEGQRGFVAVDVHGEVYSLSRQANVKAKALRDRLGDPQSLHIVEQTKSRTASEMLPKLKSFHEEINAEYPEGKDQFKRMRLLVVDRQRKELEARLEGRHLVEAKVRQALFR